MYNYIEAKEYELFLQKVNFKKQLKKLELFAKDKKILFCGIGKFFIYLNDNYDLSKLNVIGIYDKKFENTKEKSFLSYQICRYNDIKKLNPDLIYNTTFCTNLTNDLDLNVTPFVNESKLFVRQNYKIIPLGQYCLPRLLTSTSRIKPTKIYGELTLPFDNNIHNNIDKILDILNNNFENYFDGLEYSELYNFYINKKFFIQYIYDGKYSKEEFINKYKQRIDNFKKYMKSDKYLFFIMAVTEKITEKQIYILKDILTKYRKEKPFYIIIINNDEKNILNIKDEKVKIIYKFIERNDSWSKFFLPQNYNSYKAITKDIEDYIKKQSAK